MRDDGLEVSARGPVGRAKLFCLCPKARRGSLWGDIWLTDAHFNRDELLIWVII